jgi:hypothetical protein
VIEALRTSILEPRNHLHINQNRSSETLFGPATSERAAIGTGLYEQFEVVAR